MSQGAARIGPPRRLAIDVRAVANLVGTLAKYLGLVVVFPIGVALWYGDPVWPFLVTGVGTSVFGLGLERLTAGARHQLSVREGLRRPGSAVPARFTSDRPIPNFRSLVAAPDLASKLQPSWRPRSE